MPSSPPYAVVRTSPDGHVVAILGTHMEWIPLKASSGSVLSIRLAKQAKSLAIWTRIFMNETTETVRTESLRDLGTVSTVALLSPKSPQAAKLPPRLLAGGPKPKEDRRAMLQWFAGTAKPGQAPPAPAAEAENPATEPDGKPAAEAEGPAREPDEGPAREPDEGPAQETAGTGGGPDVGTPPPAAGKAKEGTERPVEGPPGETGRRRKKACIDSRGAWPIPSCVTETAAAARLLLRGQDDIRDAKLALEERLLRHERTVQDLLHLAEFRDMDRQQSLRFTRKLAEARRARRKAKDELAYLARLAEFRLAPSDEALEALADMPGQLASRKYALRQMSAKDVERIMTSRPYKRKEAPK